MNFEYKVGYLWKSHDEDPGLQSWNSGFLRNPLGRNPESARAVWSNFDQPTWKSRSNSLEIFVLLLERFRAVLTTGFQPFQLFFYFSSFSLFFSFSPTFSWFLEREQGCPLVVWGVFKPRTEDVITGEVFMEGRDCSVQILEFRFWGFCSTEDQISDKSTLSPSLLIYSWWR